MGGIAAITYTIKRSNTGVLTHTIVLARRCGRIAQIAGNRRVPPGEIPLPPARLKHEAGSSTRSHNIEPGIWRSRLLESARIISLRSLSTF